MKRTLAALAALTTLSAAPALAQDAADADAVRAVAETLSATWAAGDADGFVAQFTPDADYMAGGGVRMTGHDAIWDLHAGAFDGIYAGSTFPINIEHVRFITPDVAMIAMTCMVEPPEGEAPVGIQGQKLLATAIVRRDPDDSWRIAYMNTMPAADDDFQPPSAARNAE